MMLFEKIRKMIAERFDIEEGTITPETNIIEDLGVDSLDVAELLLVIEDEFSITVPEEKISELKTVQDLVNFIEEKTA
mgnify:FL=1